MTVNLVLFSDRGWSSSLAGKRGHCGYLGPKPSTPSQPAQPKSPKGKRPRSQLAQERPGIQGLGPDTSRPRNARPILLLDARVSHILEAFFNSSAYFPDRQLYQTKLSTGSPYYKREFIHELTPSPLTK